MLKQLLRRSRGLHAARRVLASAMAACLLLALLPAPARAVEKTPYIGAAPRSRWTTTRTIPL